jgi:inhibitor of cysteine peptidase
LANVTTTVTREDHNKTTEVALGGQLVIALEENPTTGFVWAVEERDPGVLELESSQCAAAEGASIGRGCQRRFAYRAIKTGRVELRFKLWRPWEGDRSVVDQFATVIRVE